MEFQGNNMEEKQELLDRLKGKGFLTASFHWGDPGLVWVGCQFIRKGIVADFVDALDEGKKTSDNVPTADLAVLSGFPYEGDSRTVAMVMENLRKPHLRP